RRTGFLVEQKLLGHGYSSSSLTSGSSRVLVEDAEDVLFPQDEILLVVDLDLAARILAEQNPVPRLHVQRELLAFLGHLACPHRDDLPLLGLLFRGIRDDDASPADLLLLDALDEDAIVERTKLGLGRRRHNGRASS